MRLHLLKIWLVMTMFLSESNNCFGQPYQLQNEVIIYSFKTPKGKIASLCKDKSNKYIVYRFGSQQKIELEYPKEKNESSWKKFTYSFVLRGGGPANAGLDLNYLAFVNDKFKYVMYHNDFSEENKSECGIIVIDQQTNKSFKIPGKVSTRKGSLTDFRTDKLITLGDELYD